MKNKKELIIKVLKNKCYSTREIAKRIKSNQDYANKYLKELNKEKKLICIKERNGTYWSLKQ